MGYLMNAKTPLYEPVLLAIGGHDPCGGAGLQADIESAAAFGIHCCSALSCVTIQNSCGLRRLIPQQPAQLRAQCEAILEDNQVGAIKIGLIGSSSLVQVLTDLIEEHPDIPVVLDPIFAAGSGEFVADAALLNQLKLHLLGRCQLITPNLPEARLLTDLADPDEAAQRLMGWGCHAILITGTHDTSTDVINRLYCMNNTPQSWAWPRLPEIYHGSGCTLASAIAAQLVAGFTLEQAVVQSQHYVFQTLKRARHHGHCQLTPWRIWPENPCP
jgi:hydroxymethylpyrimidine/phosphomethylpyrimidine kinase